MEQLFYDPNIATNTVLPEEESQHCVRVLRLKEGDKINVTDGKGFLYNAVLIDAHPKHCSFNIVETMQVKTPFNFNIHIAIAPTKNMDRMEWFVEKATEIGINTITFLRCRYSERRDIKLQRLEKTAISAMKQSQKATLPEIKEIVDFKDFIKQPFDAHKMIAHCAENEKKLIKSIYKTGEDVLILIGPEGDFSNEEIIAAEEAGFQAISLGESRLRTETAALTACHTIHVLNQ